MDDVCVGPCYGGASCYPLWRLGIGLAERESKLQPCSLELLPSLSPHTAGEDPGVDARMLIFIGRHFLNKSQFQPHYKMPLNGEPA